jgi:hypothetical protein
LDLGAEWARRWTATWKYSGAEVTGAVRDLASMPTVGCEPGVEKEDIVVGRRELHERPGAGREGPACPRPPVVVTAAARVWSVPELAQDHRRFQDRRRRGGEADAREVLGTQMHS